VRHFDDGRWRFDAGGLGESGCWCWGKIVRERLSADVRTRNGRSLEEMLTEHTRQKDTLEERGR